MVRISNSCRYTYKVISGNKVTVFTENCLWDVFEYCILHSKYEVDFEFKIRNLGGVYVGLKSLRTAY